ncbi:MAG: type I methionyl aminopeptidase [Actinomycetota bacterium]|nr:type I methionyl aminopeptidase [Actinomycetota bacterium]
MIIKKTPSQIAKMERAGRMLAEVIAELGDAVKPGVMLKELDEMADRSIRLRGAVPSFLGYRGFPATICASPNEVVVHGIPGDQKLEEGDIFSADFGLILDGWHADSACTFAVGDIAPEARRLLEVTVQSLEAGIAQCRAGNRLGDVGHAIEEVVAKAGFSVVREFVGHGIGRSLHEDPQVPNFGEPGRGPMLEEGWVLAVEPMVTMGDWRTKILDDGWTVVTADSSLSAHFEHTVAVTSDGPKILTAAPTA